MHDSELEHAIASAAKDIFLTVEDSLNERRVFPALILLYTTLDIFGSLLRPKSEPDTSGQYFKTWAGIYMLKGSSLLVTPDDLWGARCGLLHTNTPGSRISRTGQAREIHYVRGNKDFADFLQKELQKAGDNTKVVVDIDMFFDAFSDGVVKFVGDIQTNAKLRETVFYHAKTMFSHSTYKVPQPPTKS